MLVPVAVQQQIVEQAPRVAYVPSRLPSGWRYSNLLTDGSMLELVFRGGKGREIDYFVLRSRGACSLGSLGSTRLASGIVYWAKTVNQQSAWRCVGTLKLMAATSLPPDRLSYVVLARLVASGRHLG